jgi:molybdopterin-guanine dinucleotide biosynthesis protein B
VILANTARFAILHEYREAPEMELEDLLPRLEAVDLVIVEGFKRHSHPKIEVHRPSHGKPPRGFDDPALIAIATDAALADPPAPVLDLNDLDALAAFVVDRLALGDRHNA